MKKLITLLSLAVAPVLFAQEKKMSAQEIEHKKQEQLETQKAAQKSQSLQNNASTQTKKANNAEIKATKKRQTAKPGAKAKALKEN